MMKPTHRTPQDQRLAAAREANEALLAFARMLDALPLWPGFFPMAEPAPFGCNWERIAEGSAKARQNRSDGGSARVQTKALLSPFGVPGGPATAVQTPTVRKHAPHQARLACPSVQQAARADQSVRAASRRLDSYTAKPYMPPWMSSTIPRRTRPTAPNTACRSPSAPSCSRTVSVAVVDNRRDYGEIRINAFGPVNNRLFVCTYTMRGETHRLISVRKASRQEQNTWLR